VWRGGGEVRGDYPTLIHLTRFSTLSKGTRALSSPVQLNYFPKYTLLLVVKTCALGSSLPLSTLRALKSTREKRVLSSTRTSIFHLSFPRVKARDSACFRPKSVQNFGYRSLSLQLQT
jgi:hypothetical protein